MNILKKLILTIIFVFVTLSIFAQSNIIKGMVTDKSGSPLVGVTVVVVGGKAGTISDINGNFKLTETTTNVVLKFSYIGFDSKEVKYKSGEQLVVKLEESAIQLKETVVVGYGSQEKKTISSSVSTVNMEDITRTPSSTLSEALAGKLAGVSVETASGDPGQGAKITIRGNNTMRADGANEPLVVIDGFIGGDLNSLNPNEIETMQVLKDAASASIYGSRGANGVIIITTKATPQNQKLKVEYTGFVGISQAQSFPKSMNSQSFVDYVYKGLSNQYNYSTLVNKTTYPTLESYIKYRKYYYPGFFKADGTGPARWMYDDVDWAEQILRNALSTQNTLTFSGKHKGLGYRISGGYNVQDGVIKETGNVRYNLNTQFSFNITQDISARINTYFNNSKTQNKNPTTVRDVWQAFPMVQPQFEDGTWADPTSWQNNVWGVTGTCMNLRYYNPLRDLNLLRDFSISDDKKASLYLNWKINKRLNLTSTVSYLYRKSTRNQEVLTGYTNPTTPYSITNTFSDGSIWLQENYLTYDFKKKKSPVQLNVVMGNTLQGTNMNGNSIKDNIEVPGAKSQITNTLASFYSRFNFNYDYRYLLTGTVRTDASSRFGVDNRWGWFPSLSAGWVISNEGFLKDNKVLSTLKLKASAGVTGNENIPVFDHWGVLKITKYLDASGNLVDATTSSSLGNNMLSWETTKDYNIGLEVGFFQNRISLLVEKYVRNTDGLLFSAPVPAIMGHTTMLQNIGDIRNEGIELSFSTRNIIYKNFSWLTTFNISQNRNTVMKLGYDGAPVRTDFTITEENKPMGMFYVFKTNGLYQTQEEIDNSIHYDGATIGNNRIIDTNDDKVIDPSDRVGVGNPEPKFTAGLLNTFKYYNISLAIQLTGSYGNQVMNGGYRTVGTLTNDFRDASQYAYDHSWSPENPNARFALPMLNVKDFRGSYFFDTYIEDASFLRIQSVVLTYDFSKTFLRRSKLQALSVNLNIQNLFTFTNYSGLDPQASWGYRTDPLRRGVDYYDGYPIQRTASLGLKLSF